MKPRYNKGQIIKKKKIQGKNLANGNDTLADGFHPSPHRVEKSGEHCVPAPGTPKVSPRNTQGKKLSKRCSYTVSSHKFCENSLIINISLLA